MNIYGQTEVLKTFHRYGDRSLYPVAVTVKVSFTTGEPLYFTCDPNDFEKQLNAIGSRLFLGTKAKNQLLATLRLQLDASMHDNHILRGFYFEGGGFQQLDDGRTIYVLGDEVFGDFPELYCTAPTLARYHLLQGSETEGDFSQLIRALSRAKPIVRMSFAFVLMALLKSTMADCGFNVQGVLYFTGKSSLGKSYLAKMLCGAIVDTDSGRCPLAFEAGSSPSAMCDAMDACENLPLLLDDLCISTSARDMNSRMNKAAPTLRIASSDMPIIKKAPDKTTRSTYCKAGVMMTAEYNFEELSDVNRCIFLPFAEYLDLPKALTSTLFGSGIASFLYAVSCNYNTAIECLKQAKLPDLGVSISERASENLSAVHAVGALFAEVAYCLEPDLFDVEGCDLGFGEALVQSVQMQAKVTAEIDAKVPKGNLAFLLYHAFESCKELFAMAKNGSKLSKKEGIFFHGDFCLKPEPLLQFVRSQDGYQNWTLGDIVKELRLYGALVIHESGTVQTKVDGIRVYRMRVDVLKLYAEEY